MKWPLASDIHTVSDAPSGVRPSDANNGGNELSDSIKKLALETGFDLVGITQLLPSKHSNYIREWFSDGKHGSMEYLQRHAPTKIDPQSHWPWVKSVIVLGLNYRPPASGTRPADGTVLQNGKIAAYAVGRDYHRVMAGLIKRLAAAIGALRGQGYRWAAGVDTAPLLEREMATRAGLGWIGKNTMVINPKKGSWFVLGELLTDLVLPSDLPMADHCGSCRRCIEACPTDALTPYQMDARRCISYQLIENRGDITAALHQPIREAGFLVGCDICQVVCPHNSKAPVVNNPVWESAPVASMNLSDVAHWDELAWDRQTRGRATRRVKLPMWKRNAAILAGPTPTPVTVSQND
jgi:epoxyqueuosine reductase